MEAGDSDPSTVSPEEERASKRRRISTAAFHPPPREVGLMRSVPGDKISSFVGSSSGIYFIRSVYGAIRNSHPNTADQIQTPESDIVPGEDDHLPSAAPDTSKRLWRDHEINSDSSSLVTFQNLLDWSRSYFANWHPAYPFLHAPAILKFFEKVSKDGCPTRTAITSPEMTTLRAIMSISLADRRQSRVEESGSYPASLVFRSYEEAIDSVQHAFSQPVSIQSLQAALSVQLFLVSMLRLNAASRLGGLIIRMALQMGLHRCSNRYPSFSAAQRELRHRIFFSLYCIDRFICQSTGLPLSLRDDDIDVCYPSLERHAGGNISTDTRLRFLEFLSRHCHIRGEIMEFKHKCIQHTRRETDQAIIISSKLSKLANDVEEFIDSDECDPPTLSAFHQTLLSVLYHESVISLNRPIVASYGSGSAYNAALQQCIGSARSIITALHKAIKPVSNRSHPHFPLLWPSFTWAVWMSTFILFHAANSKHVSEAMVSRLAERSHEVLKHLARRGSVWPEACAAAIRDLSTQLARDGNKTLTGASSRMAERTNASFQSPTVPPPSSDRNVPSGKSATSPHVISRSEQPLQRSEERLVSSSSTVPNADAISTVQSDVQFPWAAGLEHFPLQTQECDGSLERPAGNPSFESDNTNSDSFQLGGFARSGLNGSILLSGDDGLDPFAGFDIPFWLGQDQYSGMVNEWS